MDKWKKNVAVVIAACGALLAAGSVIAQAWPAKPVKLVLGFPPGSAPDTIGRMLAEKFTTALAQPFVMENRPGAAATIAASQVAQSPADGYTIMIGLAASMSTGPHLLPSAKYHPAKDFAPIGFIQRSPYYLFVRPDLPISSLADLIAHSKSKPGTLNFASPGIGTQHHLTWELLMLMTGAKLTHVPLSGTSAMINETIGGRTDVGLDASALYSAQAKVGKLKMIAMTGARELPIFPGVQPMRDQGVQLESYAWWGLVAPAGIPREIVVRMNAELNKALASPELVERLTAEGAITDGKPGSTPEELGQWIANEYERWGKVIKDAGIKL